MVRPQIALVRLEVTRSIARWVALAIVAAGCWFLWNDLPEGVWLWSATSATVPGIVVVAGPIAAAGAAVIAGRNRRSATLSELERTASLEHGWLDWAPLLATAIWYSGGYATVVLAAMTVTGANATWGGPVWWPVATGWLALMVCTGIGYLSGRFIPGLFVAPIVAVVAWLGSGLLSALDTPLRVLSPAFYPSGLDPVVGVQPDVAGTQIAWFGGLLVGLVGVLAISHGAGRLSALLAPVAVVLLGIGLLSAPSSAATTDAVAPAERPPPECEPGVPTVCVHPAYAGILPELAPRLRELYEPLKGCPQPHPHCCSEASALVTT